MKLAKNIAEMLIGLYGIALAGAFLLSDTYVYADIVRHFLPQMLFGGMLIVLIALACKVSRNGVLGILLIALAWFGFVHPLDMEVGIMESPDLFFMNTLYFNTDNPSIISHISETKPKTVALVEVYPDFEKALFSEYGSPDAIYYDKGLSIGVWSKEVPVSSYVSAERDPFARVEYQDYILYVLHPRPPVEQEFFDKQHAYFKEVEKRARHDWENLGKPVYIAGDYNAAPYSSVFRAYFSEWHFHKIYSWQRLFPWGLAIDNVVSSEVLEVIATPVLSSDHSGLQVRFPQK